MGKCTANNAQITQMTNAMSDLKSLMSGGPSGLVDMTAAQDKIKEGFDILAGKNTGPMTLTYCDGFDPTKVDGYDPTDPFPESPSSEAACVAAGGTWRTREVENFNLQDELNNLNGATSGLDFSARIDDIQKKFGDLVPDLNEKIKAVSPEAGNFAENFKMPSFPAAGSEVDICTCSDPLYGDQESCEANGGTWNCRKGTMPDIGSLFSGLSSGQLPTGNSAGIFAGLGIDMESLNKQASGFFPGGGLPSLDPAEICKKCENIEIKDKVTKDPLTGAQTIIKSKEVPAVNPKVSEEPPAPSSSPPPVKNELTIAEKNAVNALENSMSVGLDNLYKGSKAIAGTATGFDKLVKDYKDAHIYWFIIEFAKAVGGDSNVIIAGSKTKVGIIFPGEAKAAAVAWFKFLDGRELSRKDLDKTLKPMLFNAVKAEYAKRKLDGKTTKTWEEALQIQYDKMRGDTLANRQAALAEAPSKFNDALKQFNLGGGFSNMPKFGETTEMCRCIGGRREQDDNFNDIEPTSKSECEALGGEWSCVNGKVGSFSLPSFSVPEIPKIVPKNTDTTSSSSRTWSAHQARSGFGGGASAAWKAKQYKGWKMVNGQWVKEK